jgi:hypothetical protein
MVHVMVCFLCGEIGDEGFENVVRRVWRYQRGNQNSYIEGLTTQWPKETVQKDKQWSTKHTYKAKDRVTRTPLKPGVYIYLLYVTFTESKYLPALCDLNSK